MKLVSVTAAGKERVGILEGETVLLLNPDFDDVASLLGSGRHDEEISRAGEFGSAPLADLRLLAPVRRFRRDILCTGWNYWDHFEEGVGKRDGQEVERPSAPTFFNKSPTAIIGPTDPISFDPRISAKWDYEGEIVLIIGKQGRSIPASRARDYIFGYMLANDVSQRDLQRRHGGQWFRGKSADQSTPTGPYVVTADEINLPEVRIETLVNGEKRQDAFAKQMAFTVETLIAELSFGMTLFPGDVVLTGTPSGIGMARNPPQFLAEGDEIVVRATGLGEIRNTMTAVDLAGESDVVL